MKTFLRQYNYFLLIALIISVVSLSVAGCSNLSASYKPPYLPVKLVLDGAGNVSITGDVSIVTFVGEFSIGAQYTLNSDPDSIMVIVRNRKKGGLGFDTIYRVKNNKNRFVAVLDGNTVVQVENNQVLIDITDVTVRSIEFKTTDGIVPIVEYEKDVIAVTAVKTVFIIFLTLILVYLTIPTGIIDIVLLLFGQNFLLTTGLWSFGERAIIGWYWNHADPVGITIGTIVLITIIVLTAAASAN